MTLIAKIRNHAQQFSVLQSIAINDILRDLSETHLVLSQQSVQSLILDVGEAVDGELDAALPQQDRPHLDVLQIGHLWKIVLVTFGFNI